jgi:hypothetical protein
MSYNKRNMKPHRKQKKPCQPGSVQQAILKPFFISFEQGLNLKKDTLLTG